jgi:hypothetical protein
VQIRPPLVCLGHHLGQLGQTSILSCNGLRCYLYPVLGGVQEARQASRKFMLGSLAAAALLVMMATYHTASCLFAAPCQKWTCPKGTVGKRAACAGRDQKCLQGMGWLLDHLCWPPDHRSTRGGSL